MPIEKIATSTRPPGDWHLRDAHELAREHGVDPASGLQVHQVAQRALQHGANELPASGSRSLWSWSSISSATS